MYRCFAPAALVLLMGLPVMTSTAAKADELTDYGDVAQYGIPALALFVSASKKDTEGMIQLGLTFGVATGVTGGIKRLADVERPNGGTHSFPSGHMTNAMSGASYLHYRYGWKYGLPAYLMAGVVGLSRVKAQAHRWEDVLAGAAIANLTAYLLTDRFNENVVLVPVFNSKEKIYGIRIGARF